MNKLRLRLKAVGDPVEPAFNEGQATIAPDDEPTLEVDLTSRIHRLQIEENLSFLDAARRTGATEDDIQRVLAERFAFPYLQPWDNSYSADLIAAYEPFGAQADELRAIRDELSVRWFSTDRRLLAIVSPHAKCGCSYLAANLAIVFSQLGRRTLLVDANLRRPRQQELFRLQSIDGLSDVVTGFADTSAIVRVAPFENLSILSAGTAPPNPQEVLSRTSFGVTIRELQASFEVVLLDTGAHPTNMDAALVAAVARGALMVNRRHKTRLAEIKELHARLASVGATVVGTVLNSY
jgi:protein-tyrosine kinase